MGRSGVKVDDYTLKADVFSGQTLRDIINFINENDIHRDNVVTIFKESCYHLVYFK